MLAFRERARLVGHHRNQLWQAGVVDRREGRGRIGQASGGGPDSLVAVGRFHIEVVEFPLAHFIVGLVVNELEPGPAAVGGITVGDPVAIEPVEVLVDYRLPQALEAAGIAGGSGPKERFVDDAGDLFVAAFGGMDAVGGQKLGDPGARFLRGSEQVDAEHIMCLADLFECRRVEGKIGVMELAIGPVGPGEIFVHDWRKHNQFGCRHAVVFLRERVLDESLKLGAEGGQARGTGMRFIGTKEGKDHVGPCAGQFQPVFADAFLRFEFARIGDRGGAGEPLVWRAEVGAP